MNPSIAVPANKRYNQHVIDLFMYRGIVAFTTHCVNTIVIYIIKLNTKYCNRSFNDSDMFSTLQAIIRF
jgi:hypothetical protein